MKTRKPNRTPQSGRSRTGDTSTGKGPRAGKTNGKSKPGIFDVLKGLVTGGAEPKATSLLESQHRKVEKLFAAIESANGNARALVDELATNLVGHMVIEEKIFYPAALPLDSDLVLEGYEEHAIARFALERLVAVTPKDPSFKARAKTLKDLIASHVKEEESELLPKVDKSMSSAQLRTLGLKMKERFDAVVASGWKKALETEGPTLSPSQRRASARSPSRKPSGSRASSGRASASSHR